MAQDVPAASAMPGPTGHPKGSPAERVKLQIQKVVQDLGVLYQECHELTGSDPSGGPSPECQVVHMLMQAASELGAHIGKGLHEGPMGGAAPSGPAVPSGPPMGRSPFAGAAAGLHQDTMAAAGGPNY